MLFALIQLQKHFNYCNQRILIIEMKQTVQITHEMYFS